MSNDQLFLWIVGQGEKKTDIQIIKKPPTGRLSLRLGS